MYVLENQILRYTNVHTQLCYLCRLYNPQVTFSGITKLLTATNSYKSYKNVGQKFNISYYCQFKFYKKTKPSATKSQAEEFNISTGNDAKKERKKKRKVENQKYFTDLKYFLTTYCNRRNQCRLIAQVGRYLIYWTIYYK